MEFLDFDVQRLTARGGDKVILKDVGFRLRKGTFTALMGPMGSGKSTFLNVLAGVAEAEGLDIEQDIALYRGGCVAGAKKALFLRQNVRDARSQNGSSALLNARLEEIDAICRDNDETLCTDEPTAGLSDEDGRRLMAHLKEISRSRGVVMVSHKTGEVRDYCDEVVLFGGGQILEQVPVPSFFGSQGSSHAQRFLKTGGLDLPGLDTPISMLSPEHRSLPADIDKTSKEDGNGLVWVLPEKMAVRNSADQPPTEWPIGARDIVMGLHSEEITVHSRSGKCAQRPWLGGRNRPDLDSESIVWACLFLDQMISENFVVILDISSNLPCAAAILASFLVMRGAPPDEAIEFASTKIPNLHFGMRLEQLIWDMDIKLGMNLTENSLAS